MIEATELERWKRQLRAMLTAASHDDPEGFASIVKIIDHAQKIGLPAACRTLRDVDGYSWAEIARPLGVTRAAARSRFGGISRAKKIDDQVE